MAASDPYNDMMPRTPTQKQVPLTIQDKMKRTANDLSPIDSPYGTKHFYSEPVSPEILTAKHREEIPAGVLGSPFESGNEIPKPVLPSDFLVNIRAMQSTPKPVSNAPALSNAAIADILRKTKPDCPKAQAWIKATEVADKAKEENVKEKAGQAKKAQNDSEVSATKNNDKASEPGTDERRIEESAMDRVRAASMRFWAQVEGFDEPAAPFSQLPGRKLKKTGNDQ